MWTWTCAPLIALFSLSVVSLDATAQQPQAEGRAVGVWAGRLTVGAMSVRLQMTIRRDSMGQLAGVMKAIDQGGMERPATVEARGDTVSFAIPDQRVTYSGVMNAAGDSIRGTFVQGQAFPLILVRSRAETPTARQEPILRFHIRRRT